MPSRVTLLSSALTVVAVFSLAAQTTQKPPDPQRPTFKTEANYVRVDVYPTQNGSPVKDLTMADFDLLEDGISQKIDTFEFVQVRAGMQGERRDPNTIAESREAFRDPRARVFVLFLDVPHVTIHGSWNMREPLVRLIDRILAPDDLIGIMIPRMSASDIVFARKTEVVAGGLRDRWPWGERFTLAEDEREIMYQACYPWQTEDMKPVVREMVARRRERMTLDSLSELVRWLRYQREERKAILTVSEGWAAVPAQRRSDPSAGHRSNGQALSNRSPARNRSAPARTAGFASATRWARNVQQARMRSRSTSTLVANRQRPLLPRHHRRLRTAERELLHRGSARAAGLRLTDRPEPAAATIGGPSDTHTKARQPPGARRQHRRARGRRTATISKKGLRRMADDLTSYYLLGYYSTNAKLDGRCRTIKVRVNRPGVDVRARKGYKAATEKEVTEARNAAAPAPVAESMWRLQESTGGPARLRRIRGVPRSRDCPPG